MNGIKRDCTCPRARHEHGTVNAYRRDKCGCAECLDAYRAYHREWRRAHSDALVDRIGTTRRLQALAADGWSLPQLGRELNMTAGGVWHLRERTPENGKLQRAIAEYIADQYERLWPRTPSGRYVTYSRNHAARQGWAESWRWEGRNIDDPDAEPAPLAVDEDVDEIAVERYMTGALRARPQKRATPELIEAIRRLHLRGLTDTEVAERVGLTRDAVMKQRERHDIYREAAA